SASFKLYRPARRRPVPRTRDSPLPADLRHRPRRRHESRFVDAMLELFVTYGEPEEGRDLGIRPAVAQCRLDVPFASGEEAGPQLTVGGDANAVATRAERLRHRVDEAELALPVREPEPPRRRRRLGRQFDQCSMAFFDQPANLAAGQDLIGRP